MALGLTQQVPIDDRHTYTREFLTDQLAILFGGRVAEELCLKHMTTGAGNDLERATDLARKMVCEWGMSRALGKRGPRGPFACQKGRVSACFRIKPSAC